MVVEGDAERTRVVGDYYFRSETDERCSILIHYPFPVSRRRLYPRLVRAWEMVDGAWRRIGYVRTPDGIDWRMRFDPGEEKLIRVEYVQEVREKRAFYIVTTTKAWGRAIDVAEFEFRLPAGLSGLRSSFVPDVTETRNDTLFMRMQRTDFLPDEDLCVSWE